MILLLIDTSGPDAGTALVRDGSTLYSASMRNKNTHSESILPMIDEAITASRISVTDIDIFSAVVGPGSFTGVRIGVSTARGLSHATGKPCAAVNALDAYAARFPFEALVYPMLDARRAQVYTAAFESGRRVSEDMALTIDELLETIPKDAPALFIGDGAVVNRAAIESRLSCPRFAPAYMNRLCPEAAAHFSYNNLVTCSYNDLHPIYLRAPQAERSLKGNI